MNSMALVNLKFSLLLDLSRHKCNGIFLFGKLLQTLNVIIIIIIIINDKLLDTHNMLSDKC